MKTNHSGLDIITHFEGFSSTPYKCPAGVWTIGYGSTRHPDGQPVTAATEPIDETEALEWMAGDLADTEKQVAWLITAPLTENQFSALVSFTYNLGAGNLQSSTLRMKLNRENYDGAADEFPKWRRAGGEILAGLVKRRAAERSLFLN